MKYKIVLMIMMLYLTSYSQVFNVINKYDGGFLEYKFVISGDSLFMDWDPKNERINKDVRLGIDFKIDHIVTKMYINDTRDFYYCTTRCCPNKIVLIVPNKKSKYKDLIIFKSIFIENKMKKNKIDMLDFLFIK
jgi:hypothetical protein